MNSENYSLAADMFQLCASVAVLACAAALFVEIKQLKLEHFKGKITKFLHKTEKIKPIIRSEGEQAAWEAKEKDF